MLEQPEYPMLPKCENVSVRSISREVDIAWLAGIIDGEGCLSVDFKLAENGKNYLSVKIRVINTDVRMIQKCARVYQELGVVFYYNVNRKTKAHYKDQTAIIVASQGSCKKILEAIRPHLANKQMVADVMIDIINYVQAFPKGGNTSAYDYINSSGFQTLFAKWNLERKFFIEPSTTSRRAGEVISW
jgi:hypothetical protein